MTEKITEFVISPSVPFDFVNTVYSHGWVRLAPNEWDDAKNCFSRVDKLKSGQVVFLNVTEQNHRIIVQCISREKLGADLEQIETSRKYMLRLNEDLSSFYQMTEKKAGHFLKLLDGKGRLLRSPTLFEDVVKVICTTNIQWGGTMRMVQTLVDNLGSPGPMNRNAFPDPAQIASFPLEKFIAEMGLGYRAPFIHQLASDIVAEKLDLESFKSGDHSFDEIATKLLEIKGVGKYAMSTIMMLLGYYDMIPVDTVFRTFCRDKYQVTSDQEALQIYDGWGEYKFLAYWFDLWEGLDENV